MSNFLPKNYQAPASNSNYLKLTEGANKFRVCSDATIGFEFWTNENKPVRLKEKPQEKPSDIRLNDDGSYTIKHFWAFSVLDRKDKVVKIMEITQRSIMDEISELLKNEDWGDITGYDITITRKGQGLETRYSVQPSPHKELTKEEQSLVARTEIDLNKLFAGENPLEKKAEIVEPDEVKLEDVPF